MINHYLKNLLVILILGAIGLMLSPFGIHFFYSFFSVEQYTMLRHMLAYLFIIWPFSLLICMIAILMLIIFIRSLLFRNKNEPFEDNFIVKKIESLETHRGSYSISIGNNNVRFPEDYTNTEALIYILCGMVMIWMVSLKLGLWQFVIPVFGCVFLAAGLIIMLYDILAALVSRDNYRYLLLGGIGLIICIIPFLLSNLFWVYRYSILPAGLLCFAVASYRLIHFVSRDSSR